MLWLNWGRSVQDWGCGLWPFGCVRFRFRVWVRVRVRVRIRVRGRVRVRVRDRLDPVHDQAPMLKADLPPLGNAEASGQRG